MPDSLVASIDLPHGIRSQFTKLEERTWLDTAHQGVLPLVAARATKQAIEWKLRPWEMTTERFDSVPQQLRERLAKLLAAAASEIVLANSSSYGIHLLANGFPWRAGDEALVVRGDFPSTYLPFLGLRKRGVTTKFVEPWGPVVTPEEIEAALGPRTRMLCTTWVHSFNGHVVDAQRIGEICRRRGVYFVLNASQGIGARPLSVRELPVDAVTSVGFKWLCGPYGTGFCWLRPDLLSDLEYNQAYWLAYQTADDLMGSSDPDCEREIAARRYDVFGTANFFQFAAWSAAIDLVLDTGVEAIAAHDQGLVERLTSGLDRDRYELKSPKRGTERSTLVFVSLRRRPERNRYLHTHLTAGGVDCSLRRGQLRISPHFYNSSHEIDRALELLSDAD